MRKDEKGIDGVRKKQMLLYRNHLSVNQTFSTINDVSIQSRRQEAICEALS